MKLSRHLALTIAAMAFVFNTAHAVTPITNVYPKPIVPGQWYNGINEDGKVSLEDSTGSAMKYANDNGIPLIYVWGTTGCTYCKKFDNEVLSNPSVQQYLEEKKLVMVYIKYASGRNNGKEGDFAGMGWDQETGKIVDIRPMPLVMFYWKGKGPSPQRPDLWVRFSGRSNSMPGKGGTAAQQFIASIEKYLGDYTTTPPMGLVNITDADPASVIREGETITFTLTREGGTNEAVTATLTAPAIGYAGTVTWAAGTQGAKTLTATMPSDSDYNDPTNITFTLATTPSEALGNDKTYTVTLLDEFTPIVPTPTEPEWDAMFAFEEIKDLPSFDLVWPAIDWIIPGSTSNALWVCWTNNFGYFEASVDPDSTGTNAVDLGMVSSTAAAGVVQWWLVAGFDNGNEDVALASSPYHARFNVNELPVFLDPKDVYKGFKGVRMEIELEVATGASDPIQSFTVTYTPSNAKLPAGLTTRKDGNKFIISGVPTKANTTTTLNVTAKNSKGTKTHTLNILIADIPKSDVVGKFNVMAFDAGNVLAGTTTMTVSSAGKISARFTLLNKAYSFSSGIWTTKDDGATFTSTILRGTTEELFLKLDNGVLFGFLTVAKGTANEVVYALKGAPQITLDSKDKEFAGYYTVLLQPTNIVAAAVAGSVNNVPQGYGYLTMTLSRATVRYSGKLPDGTSLSGSTFFIKDDDALQIPIFKSLYSKGGKYAGVLEINSGNDCEREAKFNYVDGDPAVWEFNGKKAVAWVDGFGGELFPQGAFFDKKENLAAYYVNNYTFGADTPGPAVGIWTNTPPQELALAKGNNAGSTIVTIKDTSLAKTTFTGKQSNGLFSGKFTMLDDQGGRSPKSISLSFKGALVKCPERLGGAGYYLFNDTKAENPSGKFFTLKRSFGVWLDSTSDEEDEGCGCN